MYLIRTGILCFDIIFLAVSLVFHTKMLPLIFFVSIDGKAVTGNKFINAGNQAQRRRKLTMAANISDNRRRHRYEVKS